MHTLLDILASGVHDAKNQLFIAESVITAGEAKHGIDLGEARYAIETAATRLSRTLAAYRLMRQDARIAVLPCIIGDLCDEVALAQGAHLSKLGKTLNVACRVIDPWLLDRDLITDMLNNAVQNAGRFARETILLSARQDDTGLILRVEDDGPGFSTLPPAKGIGLMVAERLAALHTRHDQAGRLDLHNGSSLGGACFELYLPK